MAAIVTIAVETAMRRSEIAKIQSEDLLPSGIIRIREGKNGRSRVIPIGPIALENIQNLLSGPTPKADSISQAFFRACARVGNSGLHFHDLRHEAISRMFERGLTVPEVAAISGHLDFRMLARYSHSISPIKTKNQSVMGKGAKILDQLR